MANALRYGRREFLKTAAASSLLPAISFADFPSNPDVVIIGAGIAGLEAARTLTKQGVTFIMIDANDRIGGRVYTNHSVFNVPFDTHAHWMRASPANPLLDHAKARGFEVYRDPGRVEYFVGIRKATGDELADLHQTDALFNSRF